MSVGVTVNVTTGKRPTVSNVKVGTPITRVQQTGPSIDNIIGIDTTGEVNGSVLVFNSSSGNYEATLQLEEQNVNGGQY